MHLRPIQILNDTFYLFLKPQCSLEYQFDLGTDLDIDVYTKVNIYLFFDGALGEFTSFWYLKMPKLS